MAATHLARTDTSTTTTSSTSAGAGADPDDPDGRAGRGGDGVVRGRAHPRLPRRPEGRQGPRGPGAGSRPRPPLETWVNDAHGDPVLVVLAEPGASLAGELRRLVPALRAAVGDDRRVLVGFDRGGWSPALFEHLHSHGFDVLTWRKGAAEDIAPDRFTDLAFTDETGRKHAWRAADTTVQLPLTKPTKPSTTASTGGDDHTAEDKASTEAGTENEAEDGAEDKPASEGDAEVANTAGADDKGEGEERVFTLRQVTLAVPATKHEETRQQARRRRRRQRAPDPHPDHPHRPARQRGDLPDGRPVAAGELLPLRPDALRPGLARQLRRQRR